MYKKPLNGWLKHYDFIIYDLLCIQLAFVLSYVIRFGSYNPYMDKEYLNLAVVYELVDFFSIVAFGAYKNVLKRGWYIEFISTIKHVCIVEAITLFYLFTTQDSNIYSRISFYVMIPLYVIILYAVRVLWKLKLLRIGVRETNASVIVMAPGDMLQTCTAELFKANMGSWTKCAAVAMDKLPGSFIEVDGVKVDVVCSYEEFPEYVRKEWVDEVYIFTRDMQNYPDDLVETLNVMGIATHLAVAKVKNASSKRQLAEKVGDYVMLTSTINYISPFKLFLKRAMDIAGGLIGCLFTLLLVVFIGPAIYICSPGPIFFKQTRVGRNGKTFKMYKFRTMYMDAEERKKELMDKNKVGDGMMFKLDFDPRIIGNKTLPDGRTKTGLGQFLRKTSLDEFPQFINILKGDMSMVGTRPPTLDEWEKYEPHHRARLSFRPGLTGLWQVSGRSNITDFEEVVKLDMNYINYWTLKRDIKIICLTLLGVIKRDGAM